MKILLRPNFERPLAPDATRKVIDRLKELDTKPLITHEDAEQLGEHATYCKKGNLDELLADCDVLMPVGGDGTVLKEKGNALKADRPVIGINAGRIGFLTELELGELEHLDKLVNGEYTISKRMLLEAYIDNSTKSDIYIALNDIVLRRYWENSSILDISVHQNSNLILRQRADGMMFSTPTGSTGYCLSAGGPVVAPEMEAILLTPICAHSTFKCSMVLDSNFVYNAKEDHDHDKWGFSVDVDGRKIADIKKGEQVIVRKSDKQIKLINLGIRDFFRNFNEKLVSI